MDNSLFQTYLFVDGPNSYQIENGIFGEKNMIDDYSANLTFKT